MIVHAELSCMSCGYEIGDVEGEKGAPANELVFLPMHQGDKLLVDKGGRFRCPRCKGRVLPQAVASVKHPIDRSTVYVGEIRESITRGLMY